MATAVESPDSVPRLPTIKSEPHHFRDLWATTQMLTLAARSRMNMLSCGKLEETKMDTCLRASSAYTERIWCPGLGLRRKRRSPPISQAANTSFRTRFRTSSRNLASPLWTINRGTESTFLKTTTVPNVLPPSTILPPSRWGATEKPPPPVVLLPPKRFAGSGGRTGGLDPGSSCRGWGTHSDRSGSDQWRRRRCRRPCHRVRG